MSVHAHVMLIQIMLYGSCGELKIYLFIVLLHIKFYIYIIAFLYNYNLLLNKKIINWKCLLSYSAKPFESPVTLRSRSNDQLLIIEVFFINLVDSCITKF